MAEILVVNFTHSKLFIMKILPILSKRLAPNQWVHSTRDGSIRVRRCFVPFWNISFQGSIECSLSTKSNVAFRVNEKIKTILIE